MSQLKLSLGCWNYDRTRALMDGSIQPDGIDLNYLNMPVEETFFRMLRHQEFDVAEMSLSSCTVSMLNPQRPFLRNSFEQGLSMRLLEPRELFAPETLRAFRI